MPGDQTYLSQDGKPVRRPTECRRPSHETKSQRPKRDKRHGRKTWVLESPSISKATSKYSLAKGAVPGHQ